MKHPVLWTLAGGILLLAAGNAAAQSNRGLEDREQQRAIIEEARMHGFKGKWRDLKNQPGCKAFAKVPKQRETVTWTGPCVNGIAEGTGRLHFHYFENGEWRDSIYEGPLVKGKMQGFGTKTYYDGARYQGQWKDDLVSGKGTLYFANGDRHEGQWRRHLANGQGTRYYRNGDRFTGMWRDNRRDGPGVYIYADGRRCEGTWRNDVIVSSTGGTCEERSDADAILKDMGFQVRD